TGALRPWNQTSNGPGTTTPIRPPSTGSAGSRRSWRGQMRTRVGINGMGRIGRAVLRVLAEHNDRAFDVVAVNDIAPIETVAHLLRHDSTFGPWSTRIETERGFLALDGQPIRALTQPDPAALPWDG